MRFGIVNTLLIGEVASPKTTMKKWIRNEERFLFQKVGKP